MKLLGIDRSGADGAPQVVRINPRTVSYTLALPDSDLNTIVEMDSADANNLIIPPYVTIPFPVGTTILCIQGGAGLTTIVAGAGVTVNVRTALSLISSGQYAIFTLVKIDTNTWVAAGDLAAA